jgi:hypothetical protein
MPGEAMMSLMSGVLGMHGHTPGAEGHIARGGPHDTWRYRSPVVRWSWCLGHAATPKPSCVGDGPGATRHVATSEPSPIG